MWILFIGVSNVSAISYCLDSFRDLNNKVVDLVNKYLNYTERYSTYNISAFEKDTKDIYVYMYCVV